MKKISYILLLLIVLYSIELFCSKYLGISLRPHGAPVDCKISSDINKVLNCVRLRYMKYDAYSSGWNQDISNSYLSSRLNRLYHDTAFEAAEFTSIKTCYGKNKCEIELKDEKYHIDAYQHIIAYVKLIKNAQSFTYNRNEASWSGFGLPYLWMFARSYKFASHDIVIGRKKGSYVFYILSMEAIPLQSCYDLLIGSISAFCSDGKGGKKYLCGGYRFYFYDKIAEGKQNLSLSLDRRDNPQYAVVKYNTASYKINLND